MRYGSLDGPIAKVSRAADHYTTLKRDLHGGFDRKRRPVTVERYLDGLEYRFRIGEIEEPDPRWPLILGEAFYNLRSALDLLAYQLHVRHYKGSVPVGPPDDAAGESAFPISTRVPTQPFGNRNDIRRLGPREKAAIEWLQPYKGWNKRNQKRLGGIGQLRQTLADVNRFNVIDKHRELLVVNMVPKAVFQPHFPAEFGFQQDPAFGVSLVSNAYVDTWTFTRPPPTDQMDMHPGVLTAVGMEPDKGDRIEVLANVKGLIWGVAFVINRFARFFPPAGTKVRLPPLFPTEE